MHFIRPSENHKEHKCSINISLIMPVFPKNSCPVFKYKFSKAKVFAGLLTIYFVLLSILSMGQGNIKTEEVNIVKPYQPLLSDAEKIMFTASPATTDTNMQEIKYDVKSHLIEVPFIPAEIRAVALPKDEPEPLQNNMIKAGFGTQLTPLLDLYLSNGASDKFSYGLNANYISSNGGKVDFQDFSKTGISVFGTSYVGSTALSAKLGYDNHLVHYYGISGSDTNALTKNELKKVYSYIPVDLSFRNTKSNKESFDYMFEFHYHHFTGKPQLDFLLPESENYFDFHFN